MQPDELAGVMAAVVRSAVAPLVARVAALERERDTVTALTKELDDARVRLAVVESRAFTPGPKGDPGLDGKDGQNGQDGLGFDDLTVIHDGQRSVTLTLARDGRTKDFVVTFPCLIYRGVYALGHSYDIGDVVTHNGSAWHCQKDTTTKPDTPEGAGYWKLMVKRGDRGRDHQAPAAVGPIARVK